MKKKENHVRDFFDLYGSFKHYFLSKEKTDRLKSILVDNRQHPLVLGYRFTGFDFRKFVLGVGAFLFFERLLNVACFLFDVENPIPRKLYLIAMLLMVSALFGGIYIGLTAKDQLDGLTKKTEDLSTKMRGNLTIEVEKKEKPSVQQKSGWFSFYSSDQARPRLLRDREQQQAPTLDM